MTKRLGVFFLLYRVFAMMTMTTQQHMSRKGNPVDALLCLALDHALGSRRCHCWFPLNTKNTFDSSQGTNRVIRNIRHQPSSPRNPNSHIGHHCSTFMLYALYRHAPYGQQEATGKLSHRHERHRLFGLLRHSKILSSPVITVLIGQVHTCLP